MISLSDFPIDLKIEISKLLPSLEDLYSVCLTCKSFYSLSSPESKLWESIRLAVLRNEVASTVAIRALLRVKTFKRRRTLEQSTKELPDEEDEKEESPPEFLQRGLRYHRRIRWFTKEVFQFHFSKRTQQEREGLFEPKLSMTEIKRVEEAFWILAFEAEHSFSPLDRDVYGHQYELEKWALQDKWKGIRDTNCSILLEVYEFIRVRLELLVLDYYNSLSPEMQDRSLHITPCVTRHHVLAVPNILLFQRGLGGVMDLLRMGEEEAFQIIEGHYRWDIYVFRFRSWVGSDQDNPTGHFYNILKDYAGDRRSQVTSNLQARILWKHPEGVYINNYTPWSQDEEFDYKASFWDDDRLRKWGYFPSRYSRQSEDKDFSRSNWSRSKIPKIIVPTSGWSKGCTICPENLKCFSRDRAEKERREKEEEEGKKQILRKRADLIRCMLERRIWVGEPEPES